MAKAGVFWFRLPENFIVTHFWENDSFLYCNSFLRVFERRVLTEWKNKTMVEFTGVYANTV